MKNLSIYLILLISLSSYGQDKTNPRFQIGVNFSSDICYRNLESTDGSSTSNIIVSQRDEREIPKFGFTTGLNVCFELNDNFALESGIQYSKKGDQTKYLGVNFGQLPPSFPEQVKYIYDYNYMDIPLRLNYTFGKRKVRFLTSVGVTANIFLNYKQTNIAVYSDRTEKKVSEQTFDFERINISPTISAGIDYKINDKMSLRIESIFRYGVLKIIDAPVAAYLYNGGINIGYYIGF